MKPTAELKVLPVTVLKPAAYNPRKKLKPGDKECEKIKNSIEEFGCADPLVVNADMTIIGGHQRLNVAIAMGYTEVPCAVVDIDKTREKALNIALNKITGAWDDSLLADLLKDIEDSDFDLGKTGFDPPEIETLFNKVHSKEVKEDDFDVESELKQPVFSKVGDLWVLGKHKVLCGDSTLPESYSKVLDGVKANLVLTDLPYFVSYARWKEAEEFITQHGSIVKTPSGYWQQVPQVSIAQTYLKIMNRFAEQFGLTPSSRSRIIAEDNSGGAVDEMEALLGGESSMAETRPKDYPKLKNYKPSRFMLPTSHYDKDKADRAVTFIENLRHTKGKWAGKRFWLLPWQEQIVRDLFGIVDARGKRQFRTAFVEIGKKNGKSELAAAVALYLLYADGEPSAEVYGAAADRQQASIVFDVANQMVQMTPALMKRSTWAQMKRSFWSLLTPPLKSCPP